MARADRSVNTETETETETEVSDGDQTRMAREMVGMFAKLIEEAMAASKRPFYVSEASAVKLTAAFDDMIDTLISEDGTIDLEEEETLATLKEFIEIVGELK